MSKILILATSGTGKKVEFVDLLKKNFKDPSTEIKLGNIKQIFIELSPGKIDVKVSGEEIKNYDVVYIRGVNSNIFVATTLAICLESLGIKYYDTLYGRSGPHRTKLGSLAMLAASSLPIPKTVYFSDSKNKEHFAELSDILGLPFVAKEMSLQRGKGVHLIKTAGDLEKLPFESAGGSINTYFFQEFIEKDHEYRVLTLDGKVGVWEEKVRSDENEFRNNVALGAKEIFMDVNKIPSDLARVAVNSAKVLGIQIAGVDIMTEAGTGKVYILEVNRGPGLTYDEAISSEFKAIGEFLEKESK